MSPISLPPCVRVVVASFDRQPAWLHQRAERAGQAVDRLRGQLRHAEERAGLYKTEEIRRRGPWRSVEDVEFATLEWVAWYNTRRLLEPLGYVSPDEFERAYYNRQTASAELAVLT